MKLTGARLRAFLAKPDPAVVVALIYGPDRGLVRERAECLVAALVGSTCDPFRIAEMSADQLKSDPVRLADEALALAFGGGRRVVRLRDGGDGATAAVRNLLAVASPGSALVVIEAGELSPRSSLRQLCEQGPAAAAIACYEDDAETLRRVIEETLAASGLHASPDAIVYLLANFGGDRGVTRSELEKLAIYMHGSADVGLDDVVAVVGDSRSASLDAVAFAAADGDARALDRALSASFGEGVGAVAILRAVARHLLRLLQAQAAVAGGRSVDDAMRQLKPPVIFKHQASFRQQLGRWSIDRLGPALTLVTEAEAACKSTGAPDRLLAATAIMRLAQPPSRRAG